MPVSGTLRKRMENRTSQSGAAATVALAVIVGLAGLILGPGQIAYCVFFSGTKAGEYPCQPDEPLIVSLHPDQNPIRFLAAVEYRKPGRAFGSRATVYDTSLSLVEDTVWSSTIRVSKERNDDDGAFVMGTNSLTAALQLFSVEHPGDYTFVAKRTQQHDIEVRSIAIRVRQNVTEVNTMSTVVGFLLLLVSVVIVVLSVVGARRKRA